VKLVVELEGVSKRFGKVLALKKCGFGVEGESFRFDWAEWSGQNNSDQHLVHILVHFRSLGQKETEKWEFAGDISTR